MSKRKDRKPKKRNSEEWQERKWHAEQSEQRIRDEAAMSGVELLVSVVSCGKTSFPHWRFRFEGRDVLHYWPTSGKVRVISGEERGKLDSPGAALALAVHLLGSCLDASRHLASIASK